MPVDELLAPGLAEDEVGRGCRPSPLQPCEEKVDWFGWHNGRIQPTNLVSAAHSATNGTRSRKRPPRQGLVPTSRPPSSGRRIALSADVRLASTRPTRLCSVR
jgi:hypothetical protein